MYVDTVTSNDWRGWGGMWVELNQKQYIIKGMDCGMGLDLVDNKTDHIPWPKVVCILYIHLDWIE